VELEKSEKIKEVLEWVYCIIIAVVLALIVRYFIGTPTVVQMTSMAPTFEPGDRLILNKLTVHLNCDFQRGDVITFIAPDSEYKSAAEADTDNPVAKYNDEPTSVMGKFMYYVLDVGKKSYIKRVIGLPGDYVKISNGNVYINGELLQEDYLQDGVVTTSAIFKEFQVPEGYLFVMGDNRADSKDSRELGCIPISKVESKVMLRFWPFTKFGTDWN
jgi:signal peptidase I